MFSFARRFRHLATGALLATFVSLPVMAEDSEIYVSAGTTKQSQPNVLFVIDTSQSMDNPVPSSPGKARIDVVREVALGLTDTLRNVNLGLMRYEPSTSEGGYVLQPISDIENADHREELKRTLRELDVEALSGFTPLSETYYEAARYFKGDTVDFGGNSIETALQEGTPQRYKSPLTHQCQKNYIVYLTDGLPRQDVSANVDARIPAMTGAECDPTDTDGVCMDELAAWLSDENRDLSDSIAGNQNVLSYMIGFGPDVQPDENFNLNTVAAAGGTTRSYTATDAASLTTTLQDIFKELVTDRGTFVTPSISVDAFNRAQTTNEVFFSLFKATGNAHWSGNLKKYAIKNGKLVDSVDAEAVAGGFFREGARSFWSPSVDGMDVEAGGAVSRLGAAGTREIYTSISSKNLTTDTRNALTVYDDNADGTTSGPFTDSVVGTGDSTTACSADCKNAIRWARGDNIDTATPTDDFVQKFGDPLHGQPAVVTYGNYDPTDPEAEPDTYVFMPTNDGMLHAFDGRSKATSGGKELWAYIPPELLNRLGPLRADAPTANRTFGLDGDVRVLKLDKNQNGIIEQTDDPETSDRVWLFFGMRSGGNHYYGLDVTDPEKPVLLWNIGPEQLPGVGLTWSPPVITRVNVDGGNDDDEKFVLIFGGGYDYAQETQTYSTDATGNRIFMVDASTGKLLWFAGGYDTDTPPAVLPDLKLTTSGRVMDNAIPGRITVIDHNGDQFADRMYAGDMGGRVWRFDIFNTNARATLVRGGVFAVLGNGSSGSPGAENNRRFYNAPDVALVQKRGSAPYYNIALGSGYRGHPLDRTTVERFYSLRDKDPFTQFSEAAYASYDVIEDSNDVELPEVSDDPSQSEANIESRGWKFTLTLNGGGEKVLAEATTVDGVILFPTYEPVDPGVANPCAPTSINRVYALTAFAGKPAVNFNNDANLNNADVFTTLQQQGIVGAVNVALLRDEEGGGSGTGGNGPLTKCLVGVEILNRCVDVGGTVRTYWQRNDVP